MSGALPTLQSSGADPELRALGPWFHNLHLPDGRQTAPDHPLGDYPRIVWTQLAAMLEPDLRGLRVLDIGCNAGFYSFELARRGASVLAVDHDPHYLRQAEWARARFALERQVELARCEVWDLARLRERFDLVLFLGVFYHLRYPLLGLDIAAARTRDRLAFQSLTLRSGVAPAVADLGFGELERLADPEWPRLAFIEHALAGDESNWWVPNTAAVQALLRSAGLDATPCPGGAIYLCRRAREPDAQAAGVLARLAGAPPTPGG